MERLKGRGARVPYDSSRGNKLGALPGLSTTGRCSHGVTLSLDVVDGGQSLRAVGSRLGAPRVSG